MTHHRQCLRNTAQRSTNPRDELAQAERLDQIIIPSNFKTDNAIHLRSTRSEKQDRKFNPSRTPFSAEIESTGIRQPYIKQDEVKFFRRDQAIRIRSSRSPTHKHSLRFQRDGHVVAKRWFVFDKEDMYGPAFHERFRIDQKFG